MLEQKDLPRCEKLDGSTLRIVPAYTEAGRFCEANCITITDGERTAVYAPVTDRGLDPMRELHGHKVNGCNEALQIVVCDEPGSGGAHHCYQIINTEKQSSHGDYVVCDIEFQNGPIKEVGTNGVTHEALIEILIDRLQCFQSGPFASAYNAEAISFLQSAKASLQQRTKDRLNRGVEGTHTV